ALVMGASPLASINRPARIATFFAGAASLLLVWAATGAVAASQAPATHASTRISHPNGSLQDPEIRIRQPPDRRKRYHTSTAQTRIRPTPAPKEKANRSQVRLAFFAFFFGPAQNGALIHRSVCSG